MLTPEQMALLTGGLRMMDNRGLSTGQALSQGGLAGINSLYDAQRQQQSLKNSEALNAYRQQQLDLQRQGQEQENARRKTSQEAIARLGQSPTRDQIANYYLEIGDPKGYLDVMKQNRAGVPTGFNVDQSGNLTPMSIDGGGNYMDYQMELAKQKAMIPGYGDIERLRLAEENARMQQESHQRQMEKTSMDIAQKEKELKYPKLTEAQSKSTAFVSQMNSANNTINQIEQSGFDPNSFGSQVSTSLAGGVTNIAASPMAQQYRQAQEQWSEAYLRFKTGAAATQAEVDRNIRTFFPQIGDSPQVVQQKAIARKQAENDVLMTTGQGRELIKQTEPTQQSIDDIVNQYTR